MEIKIGKVTHYYNHIGVAVLDLTGELRLGDRILIIGHTTDLSQVVMSMEIEHRKVQVVAPGEEVALKVAEPVHKGDEVYKIVEEA
jgi:translation elongation factor EF-1alpha